MTRRRQALAAGIRGVLAAVALVAAGCARDRGPATAAYLRAEHDLVEGLAAAGGPEFPGVEPRKPVPPSGAAASDAGARRLYSDQLTFYYSVLIDRLGRESRALSGLRDRMGAVDPAGADPDAVRLVEDQEGVFAAGEAMIREVSLLYNRKRAALVQFEPPNALDERCIAAVEARRGGKTGAAGTAGYWTGAACDEFTELTDTAGLDAAARALVDGQTARFRDSQAAARRAAALFQAEQSRIMDSLSARYPGELPAR
jgi:hypothetical protein